MIYYIVTIRWIAQISDLMHMTKFLNTPIRRLEGVAYWVIEDPEAIYDFINTEVKKEWEADARSEGRDPKKDSWLKTLSKRRWNLTMMATDLIRLNPDTIDIVNSRTGYNFAERLAQRSEQLQTEIVEFGHVVWPVIVKQQDMQLVDGYCRYAALKTMGVSRIYAYVGVIAAH